jgi:hypothetical protein
MKPPPKTRNGPEGVASPTGAENGHQAAEDTVRVQRGTDKRSFPRQLPIVRTATAFPPAWGMVTVLIVLDSECECGYYHAHRVKAPAPALLRRKARCGTRYELALHAPRVRRNRRAA